MGGWVASRVLLTREGQSQQPGAGEQLMPIGVEPPAAWGVTR